MLLDKVEITKPFPFIGRAASRGMVGTLNFTIAALAASHIRKRNQGVPVEELSRPTQEQLNALQERFGNTLDARNEIDGIQRGAEHEAQQREVMGYGAIQEPLELAGLLKVVRDSLAHDLDSNARMLTNELGQHKVTYLDPYEAAEPLEASFIKQLEKAPKINEARCEAEARMFGVPLETVIRLRQQEQEAGQRFLRENRQEIHKFLQTIVADRGLADNETVQHGYLCVDGVPCDPRRDVFEKDTGKKDDRGQAITIQAVLMTPDEADTAFAKLPAIRQASLYVAAVRGLFYENDRWLKSYMRGHPDGKGNLKALSTAYQDIKAEFNRRMDQPSFKREIGEAVERGAQWPVLPDMPTLNEDALKAA